MMDCLRRACLVAVGIALPSSAAAHYCSNIFAGPARLVVKPETTTVNISGTSTATLKVYLQNNFPYKLFAVKMRGQATNYTIAVNPTAGQDIQPGQNVLYTYSIKHNTGFTGAVQVSTLNLQVQIRIGSWRGSADKLVNQTPAQSLLTGSAVYLQGNAEQTPSLNMGTLADLYPTATLPAGSPTFGHTGIQQLSQMFGYRFCFDSGGTYACGGQDCPSPCAEKAAWSDIEQFPQDCMRAGVELGVRKAKLGSQLQAVRDGAVNAMKAGSAQHRCLAAVVGGVLWQGAASTTTFENGLNSLSAACKAAGLRALGKGTAGSCSGLSAYHEQAACAAAEGLQGVDAPVSSILMPNAGDGNSCASSDWHRCHYYAYMLYLVTGDRYGQGKTASYYPPVGPTPTPDTSVPKLDKGGPTADGPKPPPPDYGPHPDGWTPPDGGAQPGKEAGMPPAGDGSRPDGGGCCALAGPQAPPATSLLVLAALGLTALVLRRRRQR
jgi:hypothetical protein